MFKDLRTGTKLLILVAIFSALIAVALYDLITDRRRGIDFIRRELAGEQYLATVRDLYARMLAGQSSELTGVEHAKDKSSILTELARAETDSAGRMRTASLVREVDAALRDLWSSDKAAATLLVIALEKLRALALRIGDESNLALDYSLDRYHLANIVITKLPVYAAALGEAQALLHAASAGSVPSEVHTTRMLILADLLRWTGQQIMEELDEAYHGDVEGGVKVALDARFSAMASNLGPYLSSLSAGALARQASAADITSSAHRAYADAVESTTAAWVAAQDELDRLLRARLDALSRQLHRSLALIGGLAGLGIVAGIMTHRHVVRPLERLHDLANRVSETKDYSLRIDHKSRDEVGQLAGAFNEMLGELAAAREREAHDRERSAQQALALLVDVTSAASAATSISALASACLDRICTSRQWQFGQVWYPDHDGASLRCSADSVYGKPRYESFHQLSLATALHKGQGLPGQAWDRRSAIWISEAPDGSANYPRLRAARKAGFMSSFAFPAIFDEKVVSVFEFMSTEARPPDRAFMDAVDKLGSFLGDITARLQSQQEKRIAQDHFRLVVEASPSGMLLVDQAGKIMMANPEIERVFGHPRAELIGQPIEIMMAPRFRGQHPQFRADFMAHPGTRAMGAGRELFGLRKDGTEFPIEVGLNPVAAPGGPMVLAIVVDITERKRADAALRASQERWRSVFENTTVGIAILDESLHHLSTNSAFRALLGYTDAELAQLTPMEISVGDEQSLTQERLIALRRGELKHFDIEKQYRRRSGDLIWVHAYASVVSDEEGKVLIIKIIMDITESRRAQDALRQAQSELARASRLTAMGQLTASIAHEISQPLQAVVAYGNAGLRWLRKNPPRLEDVENTLRQIVSDGDRATRTIESVRAIFNKDRADRTLVDINELIVEVLQLLHGELQARRISVRTELDPSLPKTAAARGQIQQVILNLVMNAAEAMIATPEDERTLTITSQLRESGEVVFTVADCGPGIDQSVDERIFEPFFTTKATGMGIGLAICRSIVEAHQGRLSIVRGATPGASLEVVLPAANPNADDGM